MSEEHFSWFINESVKNDWLPEQVLGPEFIKQYNSEIDAMWWQVIKLNTNVFILKKITGFPLEFFSPPKPLNVFWSHVILSLVDSCVLIIGKLTEKSNRKSPLSLFRLKNRLLREYILRDPDRTRFKELMNKVADPTKHSAFQKIIEMRHNQIAHFDYKWNVSPNLKWIKERNVEIGEIAAVAQVINDYFSILCLGMGRSVIYPEYMEQEDGTCGITDIDTLLNSIAKDSDILNMPESQPDYWNVYKTVLTAVDFEVLNLFRKKFGLAEL